ncbi:MAG TPA: FKBP-type peptidyl-prolyl cis-trans isomerase [Bacteroidales bacterium]|nr:FKBP-type peptidyl-prolyl cis-trans isomerase [Bacteroidales bacterium]HPI31530.1 FKBP-type peptidyl-prolyl cis-trans isomerase [Bacteroidales bacterium]HQN15085.1 FKBP-type peptidyl-prolyl cis-trans isomerase [Bacteroidales bacterium]HQP16511.1 FKBP-type peptidyl-prolyl cis-trans isomerase [Bacteroidales bacterium]
MKNIIRAAILLIIPGMLLFSCKTAQQSGISNCQLKTLQDTISYIIGADVASNLRKNHFDINPDVFTYAFNKNIKEDDTLISKETGQKIMKKYQKEMLVKQQAINLEESKKNKLAGEAFLKENKNREGIVELPSGLQYKVISPGTGAKPSADDEVTVNYEGRFLDGKIFDSSYERNEPASFPLNGVIKGWTEGLQLMNTGAVYELYIPSQLAYGDNGGGPIPGGATLVFKVELLSIKAKQ